MIRDLATATPFVILAILGAEIGRHVAVGGAPIPPLVAAGLAGFLSAVLPPVRP